MKTIPLTRGRVAIVDDDDYVRLSVFSWYCLLNDGHRPYAARSWWDGKKRRMVLMHREIMDAKKGQLVDHRDCDGLNNTRQNLRLCTNVQNCRNTRKRSGTKSQFKGVIWAKDRQRWRAQISVDKKHLWLGSFKTEDAAAAAYNEAAELHFGSFARINILVG